MLFIVLHISQQIGCYCSDYVSAKGYGNCAKGHKGKRPICYVTQPSTWTDVNNSSSEVGNQYSWEACEKHLGNLEKYCSYFTKILWKRLRKLWGWHLFLITLHQVNYVQSNNPLWVYNTRNIMKFYACFERSSTDLFDKEQRDKNRQVRKSELQSVPVAPKIA